MRTLRSSCECQWQAFINGLSGLWECEGRDWPSLSTSTYLPRCGNAVARSSRAFFLLFTVESALRKLTFKDNNGVSSRRKVTSIDVSKLYRLILQVDMYSEQSPLSLVKHKITSQEQSFRSSQPVWPSSGNWWLWQCNGRLPSRRRCSVVLLFVLSFLFLLERRGVSFFQSWALQACFLSF